MSKKDLNLKIETELQNKEALSSEVLEKILLEERYARVVHDLEVHQIELEIQNEELKKTYMELEDAKARYFDLYDLAPEGYLIVSEKGIILESNLTAANMFGCTREKLLNQKLSQYIFGDDQDIYYLHRRKIFDSLAPQECELRMMKNDGSMFWAHMKASANIDNGAACYRLILSDVSERNAIEQKLIDSEEKFKSLAMSMDQGLALFEIILDADGKPVDCVFMDINDNYMRLMGVTREMCIGKSIKEVMPSVEQYWIDVFGKVALTGEASYYENFLETTGKHYATYSYTPTKNQVAVLISTIGNHHG